MIAYAYTIQYVEDVPSTIDFYERAFGLSRKFLTPEGDYGELITGGTTLAFASVALSESNLPKGFVESKPGGKPFGIELGFTTEDVQSVMDAAVSAGATIYEAPKVKPWGQTVGYLTDINGFLIEVCTPMGGS